MPSNPVEDGSSLIDQIKIEEQPEVDQNLLDQIVGSPVDDEFRQLISDEAQRGVNNQVKETLEAEWQDVLSGEFEIEVMEMGIVVWHPSSGKKQHIELGRERMKELGEICVGGYEERLTPLLSRIKPMVTDKVETMRQEIAEGQRRQQEAEQPDTDTTGTGGLRRKAKEFLVSRGLINK
jgi:hypothetical protein